MSAPALLAEGLHKRFGDVHALDGLDLEVPAGTVYGLLGPNGAGKTTAVRVFTTILHPDAGHASVLGHDVTKEAPIVRTRIGLAGQYAAVDENLTGRENLRLVGKLTHLPPGIARVRAEELLERFALSDAANRPASTYSGGMRRRLDLAVALVHRPAVLLLDEPTTGLDPRSRNELWDVIGELVADGVTVLLTTQYLEEADRLADQVAVVDRGRVIASGTPAELKGSLGQTVLEVDLADDRAAVQAELLLATWGDKPASRDGRRVELTMADGARETVEVLRALDGAGLAPLALALREPSLDDVFLAVTGHKAGASVEHTAGAPAEHAAGAA